MADFTIEWDRDRVLVSSGSIVGGKGQFHLLESIAKPADSTDLLDLVGALREFSDSDAAAAQKSVDVILPRQFVTIHHVQLPNIPDAEVPELLALQAAMKLTVPVDSVLMDFTPIPVAADAVSRDVLLVTAPKSLVEQIRRCLADAGLSMKSVVVSCYAAPRFLQESGIVGRVGSQDGTQVLAVMRPDFTEIIFLAEGSVIFSHSGGGVSDAASVDRVLKSELSRARLAASDQLANLQFQSLVLVGLRELVDVASEDIGRRLGVTRIVRFDPAEDLLSGIPATFSGGELLASAGTLGVTGSGGLPGIDLLAPRRAPEKRDFRRAKMLASLLGALLIIAGGYFWRERKISALSGDKRLVDIENTEARERLRAGEQSLEWASKIGRWDDRDIQWLDLVCRLRELMPAADRMFVDNFTMAAVPRDGLGVVRFEAWAKTESDINEFSRVLREEGYGVKPFDIDRRPAAVSQEYQRRVIMEVVLPEPEDAESGVS